MGILFAQAGILTGVLLIEIWKRSFTVLVNHREYNGKRIAVAGLQLFISLLCVIALATVTRII